MTLETQKRYILTTAGSSLLMFFAILCAYGALISTFDFPVYLWRASLTWLITCIILSAVVLRYRYKGIFILLIPAILLFAWSYNEIAEGARWLLFTITDFYSNWLVVTVLFPESAYFEGDPTTFFTAAGIGAGILLSIAICIHRSAFITALVTIPIVMITFVVVSADYQPSFIYIFGLLAVLITILMTNALTFDDFRKRGIMTVPALLVAVIFLGAVYFINPPERFDRTVHTAVVNRYFNEVAVRVANLWERVPNPGQGSGWPIGTGGGIGGVWAFNTRYVDIAGTGATNITNRSLLEVEVTAPGAFYLRGYSMQHFDGRTWSVNSNTDAHNYELDRNFRTFPGRVAMLYSELADEAPQLVGININRTGDRTNINYIPYFTMPYDVENMVEAWEFGNYDATFFHAQRSIHSFAEEITIQHFPRNIEPYLQIEESTAEALRALAFGAGIDQNAPRTALVDAVARFVRSSATYSLTPGVVPEGEDFALYFLEYMESGFCIHFATAATLMLRALDVPARFTTGYVFLVPAGLERQTITLTDQNAHAWVEVFYDDVGWLYLEVTPGGSGSVIPIASPHTPGGSAEEVQPPIFQNGPYDNLMINGDFYMNGISPNGPFTTGEQDTGTPGFAGVADAMNLPPWLFNLLIAPVIICITLTAMLVRRHLVLKYRRKRFEQHDPNVAVISMWRYIEKIANREAVPPTDIEELALKARFSPHKISPEERKQVKNYTTRLADEIYRSKGEYAKIWQKYVRVLHV